MTENFKTSELDQLFGTKSVKTPFSGATFKEVNDGIAHAIESNPNLKMVVRGLDYMMLFYDKDDLRIDMGEYPDFLYDDNLFNDVEYVLNRDVVYVDILPMIYSNRKTFSPGLADFDDYSYWAHSASFGPKRVLPLIPAVSTEATSDVRLTEYETTTVTENVRKNITELAKANPDIDFYYFLTPYSAAWWQSKLECGEIYKVFQAEQIAVEEIVKCKNIKLFSISDNLDICADLNNYKDLTHYGPWINSLILQLMHDERYMLTAENYKERLDAQHDLYLNFDYNVLLTQEDYKDDYIARDIIFNRFGY